MDGTSCVDKKYRKLGSNLFERKLNSKLEREEKKLWKLKDHFIKQFQAIKKLRKKSSFDRYLKLCVEFSFFKFNTNDTNCFFFL